jgi:hypothetical protein
MELTLAKAIALAERFRKRNIRTSPLTAVILGGIASIVLCSCDNGKIEVYKIPKEGINVAMQNGSESLTPLSPAANPAKWTAPDGWRPQPLSEMRVGSFKVDGANGASADVSVTAFPGEAGGLGPNLNRWRGQLQLPPLRDDELGSAIQQIEIENVPTWLADFQTAANNPKPSRILGAILQTSDRTWFVKMTGPPELLELQRQKFLDFVHSFHLAAPGAAEPAPRDATKPQSTNDK